MSGFLSGVGTCKYNGVTFPNQIESNVSVEHIMDDSGRFPVMVEYNLSIYATFHNSPSGTITSSDTKWGGVPTTLETSGTGFAFIRKALSEPGGLIEFTGKGFGDVVASGYANQNTSIRDVAFGPHPRIISWTPCVEANAVEVTWECKVTVPYTPDLTGGDPVSSTFRSLVYNAMWDIRDGFTARTFSGYITVNIPASQYNVITADTYRDRFNIICPLGYQREVNSWRLSEDRTRLEFNVTDVEMESENAPYQGMIRTDLEYDIENDQTGFGVWNCSLSGTIKVAQGYPRWWAWLAFLTVLNSKLDASILATATAGQDQQRKSTAVLTQIRMREQVQGRSSSFSVSWRLTVSLDDILKASKIWSPVVGTDWAIWRTSMSPSWSPRGISGDRFLPTQDIIEFPSNPSSITLGYDHTPNTGTPNPTKITKQSPPTPANSWLYFNVDVEKITDTGTVALYPLAAIGQKPSTNPPTASTPDSLDSTNTGTNATPILQQRTSGYRVRMKGLAIRAQHPIPEPVLTKYGGSDVSLVGTPIYKRSQLANYSVPVYVLEWNVEYVLLSPPTSELYTITPDDKIFRT